MTAPVREKGAISEISPLIRQNTYTESTRYNPSDAKKRTGLVEIEYFRRCDAFFRCEGSASAGRRAEQRKAAGRLAAPVMTSSSGGWKIERQTVRRRPYAPRGMLRDPFLCFVRNEGYLVCE